MTKVIFEFDEEADLFAQWRAVKIKFGESDSYRNKESLKVNSTVIEICKGKDFVDCKDALREFLNKKYYSNPIFRKASVSLENCWREIENEFFMRMDKFMKRKCDFEIRAFVGTSNIREVIYSKMTYNITVRDGPLSFLRASGHEIMHLYFKKFYRDYVEEKIGMEKTKNLNEALTVLLNEEFIDLWIMVWV